MRKKINYEKVTFLGGFGGKPPRRKRFVACNCCVLMMIERVWYVSLYNNPSYEVGLELYCIVEKYCKVKFF